MAQGFRAKSALSSRLLALAEKPWKREAAVRACQLFNSASVVPLLKHAATKDDSERIARGTEVFNDLYEYFKKKRR